MKPATKYAVPFAPVVRPGYAAEDSAKALTASIHTWEKDGWTFSHLENVTTVVNNGCLGGFFGPAQSVISVQVAILVRDEQHTPVPTPARK